MNAARPTVSVPTDASGAARECVVSPLHHEPDLKLYAAVIAGVVAAVVVVTLGGWL